MRDYTKVRLSDDFVNMTSEVIHVYDTPTGSIKTFPPSRQELPKSPITGTDRPVTHYIFEESELNALLETGRPLDDIAIIRETSHGRHDILMSSLVWGKNTNIEVCLFQDIHCINFPHL